MNYKDQLIDLLKSDAKVKEAMEKLEFGCVMKTKTGIIRKFIEFERYNFKFYINKFYGIDKDGEMRLVNKSQYTIIGLPLQERFIRMYINKMKPKSGGINFDGTIIIECRGKVQIDNTKDFDNQSEEVYKQIFLALTNLTNE